MEAGDDQYLAGRVAPNALSQAPRETLGASRLACGRAAAWTASSSVIRSRASMLAKAYIETSVVSYLTAAPSRDPLRAPHWRRRVRARHGSPARHGQELSPQHPLQATNVVGFTENQYNTAELPQKNRIDELVQLLGRIRAMVVT